jgi:hypothetical protein
VGHDQGLIKDNLFNSIVVHVTRLTLRPCWPTMNTITTLELKKKCMQEKNLTEKRFLAQRLFLDFARTRDILDFIMRNEVEKAVMACSRETASAEQFPDPLDVAIPPLVQNFVIAVSMWTLFPKYLDIEVPWFVDANIFEAGIAGSLSMSEVRFIISNPVITELIQH